MNRDDLTRLLDQVRTGALAPLDAARQLEGVGVAPLDFATLDLERPGRCGFPEVVFAEGKTRDWLAGVVRQIRGSGQDCLATRLDDAQAEHLGRMFPQAEQDRIARTFWLRSTPPKKVDGIVAVLTAGTSDLPVAKEAEVTVRALGCQVLSIVDVGVAGLHRLLRRLDEVRTAAAVIVVAGMDGALPSVVGGLVAVPVIAVPTSIGYGTAFGGLTALLTMLNSCSANVTAVNIDAGFKAGFVAGLIVRASSEHNAEMQKR